MNTLHIKLNSKGRMVGDEAKLSLIRYGGALVFVLGLLLDHDQWVDRERNLKVAGWMCREPESEVWRPLTWT